MAAYSNSHQVSPTRVDRWSSTGSGWRRPPQANPDRGVATRSRTMRPSSNELLAVAGQYWP
jgi:hypothetical protein